MGSSRVTYSAFYGKIVKHEKDFGRYELDPTDFVPNPAWPQK